MIRSTGTLGDEKFVGGITPQLGAAIIAKTALAAVMAEQATTETNGLVGARRAGGSRARRRSRGDPGRSRIS